MARTNTYDKDFAITQMKKIIKSRMKLLEMDYINIEDLASKLGVSTTTLYSLWRERTGQRWFDAIPAEVIVRERQVLRRYK